MRSTVAVVGLVIASSVSFVRGTLAEEPEENTKASLAELNPQLLAAPEVRQAFPWWQEFFARAMQMHVEEIASDNELNPRQKQRLKLAAKGAVESYIPNWLVSVMIRRSLIDEAPEESLLADALLEEESHQQMSMLVGTWPIVRIIQREGVWQKALKATLTDEQLAAVREKAKTRDAGLLAITVTWTIGRFDETLLLSRDQQSRLKPLVRKKLSEMANPDTAGLYGQVFTLAWAYRIPREDIAVILSESQLQLWDSRKEVFNELGDELGGAFHVSDWFDPKTVEQEVIKLVGEQQAE